MPHIPKQPSKEILEYIRKYFYEVNGILCRRFSNTENVVGSSNSYDPEDHLRVGITVNSIHRNYLVHHIVWFLNKNEWPRFQLDHRDRNKQNNKIDNLREVNSAVQTANKIRRKDKLLTGVTIRKGKFQAQIRINGKQTYLGVYSTEIEAHEIYKRKYKEIYGVDYDG